MRLKSEQRSLLVDALCAWFAHNDDLLRFLRSTEAPYATWDELEGVSTSKASYFDRAVDLLLSRGLIDGSFFDALRNELPRQLEAINRLERALFPLIDGVEIPYITKDQSARALQAIGLAYQNERAWRSFLQDARIVPAPSEGDIRTLIAAQIRACHTPRELRALLQAALDRAGDTSAQRELGSIVDELKAAAAAFLLSEHIQPRDQARFDQATADFEAERYEAALAVLGELLREAEARRDAGLEDARLPAWISECRLNLGRAELCLQDADAARRHLLAVTPDPLSDPSLERLVIELAALGELERAEQHAERLTRPSRELRWALALARGELPTDIGDHPPLRLQAARVALEQGRGDFAWAQLSALDLDAALSGLHTAIAFELCVELLQRCVLESPTTEALPDPAVWPRILEAARGLQARTDAIAETLPARAREVLLLPRLSLARMEERPVDDAAIRDVLEKFPWFGRAVKLAPGDHEARAKVEEAQREIGLYEHPWRGRLEWARSCRNLGDLQEAHRELMALAAEFPRRSPILYLLGCCLVDLGRLKEAVAPLREACQLLPAWGYRLQLAKTLARLGELRAAWDLLESFTGASDPDVLSWRALVASSSTRPDCVEHARRWVDVAAEDPDAHLNLALSLHRTGHPAEAAEAAWRSFELGRALLKPEHVALLAELQGGAPRAALNERLGEMDRLLAERFADDQDAIRVRFNILLSAGAENLLASSLVEPLKAAGVLRPISPEEAIQYSQRTQQQALILRLLWALGAIDCDWMRQRMGARWLARVATQDPDSIRIPLSPALPFLAPRPPPPGPAVLMGELELLLLARVGLLETLASAPNRPRCVLVFEDVFERVMSDEALLDAGQAQELEGLETIDTWTQRREIDWPDGDAQVPPPDFAGARGLCLVSDAGGDAPRWMTPGRLIRAIRLRPGGEEQQGDGGSVALPLARGDSLVLDLGTLFELHRQDALEALMREGRRAGWRLVIDPSTRALLRDRKSAAAHQRRAAQLASQLRTWLGQAVESGVVALIPRPGLADWLGPPAVPADALMPSQDERAALTWWRALEDAPERSMCSAELRVGSLWLSSTQAWAWRSLGYENLQQLAPRIQALEARVFTLPTFVRHLIPDVANRIEALSELARLGLPDALEFHELCYLGQRYEGFGGDVVRGLLEAPGAAVAPGWLGRPMAASNLAIHLAAVIWEAHTKGAAGEHAGRWTADLLSFIEGQQSTNPHHRVEDLIANLGLLARTDPIQSVAPVGTETMAADRESPAGRMWQSVAAWAGEKDQRLRAVDLGRNLIFRQLALMFRSEGPPESALIPMATMGMVLERAPTEAPVPPATASLYALTALWAHKLTRVMWMEQRRADGQIERTNAEAFIQEAAKLLGPDRAKAKLVGLDLAVPDPRRPGDLVLLPPEALLLRVDGAARAAFARDLAGLFGAHDAIQRGNLLKLAENPQDAAAALAVATQATRALWRELRADPGVIGRWVQQPGADRAPRDIAELARVLDHEVDKEPQPAEVYFRRFSAGGSYENREDVGSLLEQLASLPGLGPWLTANILLNHEARGADAEAIADDLIATLRDWRQHPIGRVSYALGLLWALAEDYPALSWRGQVTELIPLCRATLVDILRAYPPDPEAPPTDPPRALLDPGLARVAAAAVDRLGGAALPPPQRLWLSWRLYAWMCAQLSATPTPLLHAMSLHERAPRERPYNERLDDLLDPFRAVDDPARFVARAALGGLAFAGAVQRDRLRAEILEGTLQPGEIRQVLALGDALEQEFKRLCALSFTKDEELFFGRARPSVLPWPTPTSLPGAALHALLSADLSRFAELEPSLRFTWIARMRSLRGCEGPDMELLDVVWWAVALCADRLTEPERGEAAAVLTAELTDAAPTQPGATHAVIALFKAGREELHERARALALAAVGRPETAAVWLEAVRTRLPEQLTAALHELIAAADSAGEDPALIVQGLSLLLFSEREEDRSGGRAALASLRGDARFTEDVRLRALWDIARRMEENP